MARYAQHLDSSTHIRPSIVSAFCPSLSLCYFFGGSNPSDGQVCRLSSILATNLVTSDFGAGNAELVVRCAIFIEKKNFGLRALKEEAQDFAAKMFPSRLLMVHDSPRRGQHHLQYEEDVLENWKYIGFFFLLA